MSRFFSQEKFSALTPYVPGEQPRDRSYLKLNTNESPYPPSPAAMAYAAEHTRSPELYSDPENLALRQALADTYGVDVQNVTVGNGSDELLNFAFMAFCDRSRPALFPDLTYGFYPVFAAVNGVPYREIPLDGEFRVRAADYAGQKGTVFLANPNAPTGICLPPDAVRELLEQDRERLLVADEAYVDFGGESCRALLPEYDNLLVIGTFSKSRSMAGARLGYAIGSRDLIGDLNTIRYSVNPYNVNSLTAALGIGTLLDGDYTRRCCAQIIASRDYAAGELGKRGFVLTESKSNFLFARCPDIPGKTLYQALRDRGILVRHFDKTRIIDYNRITVGTREQMDRLLEAIDEIRKELRP
ncbi:MAG: histidinol-phosphate transaminase [Oscillospiraceae bacterium]|nr:histidinol-phosphate transaminase [Oscillospiraceae bacterium]